MSKMEDMQSYFDEYPEALRKARASSSLTLAELARISGVPYNSICSVNSGATKQPLLYYSAATCKPLIFCLVGVCAILLCATIGYVIFKNIGLFRSSGLTVLAVFLAIVVLAAIALIVFAVKTVIHDAKTAKSPQD